MESDTAYFFTLVYQYNELAMIHLGKLAGPEGKPMPVNLDAARYTIDFLEMIERKTKGNLSDDEDRMLKQTLINLRLNFVEELKRQNSPKDETTEQN